jgi:type IV fimbrial biogenesis protein FimT
MASIGYGYGRPAAEHSTIRRQDGFTIAELLLTIAVGAVLFAIGMPSLTALSRNSAQVSSINELVTTFHLARDLAVTRNERITVCASASGANCEAVAWSEGWIVFRDDDDDRTVDADETIERVGGDVGPLTFSSDEFAAFLVFRPNGRVMGNDIRDNSGQFTVCDDRGDAHARVVVIDISGRPRSSDTLVNGDAPSCS